MQKFEIWARRNGNKNCTQVDVVVQLPLFIEKSNLHFTFECGSEYSAALLEDYINEKLWKILEQIRKNAYEKGYSDHRKRNKKLTEFYQDFDPDNIGY